MKRYLISPPVGSWFGALDAERVVGSFTWAPRPGRLGQIIRTVRPIPGGWVNAIGLRNPGVRSVEIRPDRIYSLAGIAPGDWGRMADYLLRLSLRHRVRVELNLSCPNVHEYGITRSEIEQFTLFPASFDVIAKLPPTVKWWEIAETCAEAGVGYLHLSNTIPSPAGGISGEPLRRVNLGIVEQAARCYPGIPIIAGGGIRNADHVLQYANAGAQHFSISTGYLRWIVLRQSSRTALADLIEQREKI